MEFLWFLRAKEFEASGLCDETQEWWDLADAAIEQITQSVFGDWVAKNLC